MSNSNSNSRTWVILAFLVIGIVFGIGPFKNAQCSRNKAYDEPSTNTQSGSDPSFTGKVSEGEYCNGDSYSCRCPGYEPYSQADWHCKHCPHVKSDHK